MPEIYQKQRQGIIVKPHCRLSEKQIQLIDAASRELLENPGLVLNERTSAEIFDKAGCIVEETGEKLNVKIPSKVIDKILNTVPSRIVLGARNPDNRLIIDAGEPRVRFGSGAETNFWLEAEKVNGQTKFNRRSGSMELLSNAAHLAENFENLDFFIRCVNIQDEIITAENKDVNMFLVCLNNITKHVQAGLTNINALDDVVRMAEIICGGKDAFSREPIISFITCVIKSPLQFVDDTVEKMITISRKNIPVVISSCAMAGTTAPFDEMGMLSQINAEVLAGVTLNQLANSGSPVFYGAVPVRTRLDNLNDMYGTAEFDHFNLDCAQMARYYKIPCYSTVNASDAAVPGIQATMEKMLTLSVVPGGGAQYIHYAFGLLGSNTFSPEQAVLDNAHIGIVKRIFAEPDVTDAKKDEMLRQIRVVMRTEHKTYMYHLPLPSKDSVYTNYPFETADGDTIWAAHLRYEEIMNMQKSRLPEEILKEIMKNIKGILSEAFV